MNMRYLEKYCDLTEGDLCPVERELPARAGGIKSTRRAEFVMVWGGSFGIRMVTETPLT